MRAAEAAGVPPEKIKSLWQKTRDYVTTMRTSSVSRGTIENKRTRLMDAIDTFGGDLTVRGKAALNKITRLIADHEAEFANPIDRNFFTTLRNKYGIIEGATDGRLNSDYLNDMLDGKPNRVPDQLLNDPSFIAAAEELKLHMNELLEKANKATDGEFPIETQGVRKYKTQGPITGKGDLWGDATALAPENELHVKNSIKADMKASIVFDRTTMKGKFDSRRPGYLKDDSPFVKELEQARSPSAVDAAITKEVDRLYSEMIDANSGLRYKNSVKDVEMDKYNGLTFKRDLPYAGKDVMEPVKLNDIEDHIRSLRNKVTGLESFGAHEGGLPVKIAEYVNELKDVIKSSGDARANSLLGEFNPENPHSLLGHLHDGWKGVRMENYHGLNKRFQDFMYNLYLTTNVASTAGQEVNTLLDAVVTGDAKKFAKGYASRAFDSFRRTLTNEERSVFAREMTGTNFIEPFMTFKRMSEGLLEQVHNAVVKSIPEYLSDPRYAGMLEAKLHPQEIIDLYDYASGKLSLDDVSKPIRKLVAEMSGRMNEPISPYSRASLFNTRIGQMLKTFLNTPFSVQANKMAATSKYGGGAYKGKVGKAINVASLGLSTLASTAIRSSPLLKGATLLMLDHGKLGKLMGVYMLGRYLNDNPSDQEVVNEIKSKYMTDVPEHLAKSAVAGKFLGYNGDEIVDDSQKAEILANDATVIALATLAGVPLRGLEPPMSFAYGSPASQTASGLSAPRGTGMSMLEALAPEFALPLDNVFQFKNNLKKYSDQGGYLVTDKNPVPGLSSLLGMYGKEYTKSRQVDVEKEKDKYKGGLSPTIRNAIEYDTRKD